MVDLPRGWRDGLWNVRELSPAVQSIAVISVTSGQCGQSATTRGRNVRIMKIATFNINNVRRRLPNLLRWLRAARPDVVCLQELKCTQEEFPAKELKKSGYGAVWQGQKTWNGVAILARKAEPVLIRTALPGDRNDTEARYIEAAV